MGPKSFLIIDDDPDDQEILVMCLNNIGTNISCDFADNGAEAISHLESQIPKAPDYIFIDVNMPKMNGIECLKNIRSMKHLDNTKVFMYSTTSEPKVVEESKRLGATEFIVKPSKIDELETILSRIVA